MDKTPGSQEPTNILGDKTPGSEEPPKVPGDEGYEDPNKIPYWWCPDTTQYDHLHEREMPGEPGSPIDPADPLKKIRESGLFEDEPPRWFERPDPYNPPEPETPAEPRKPMPELTTPVTKEDIMGFMEKYDYDPNDDVVNSYDEYDAQRFIYEKIVEVRKERGVPI